MAWNDEKVTATDVGEAGFMGRIHNSAGAATKAAEQMERLADRLIGASPPTPAPNTASAKLREVPSGLFAEVESSADSISESVERIFTAIRRIEDRLPIN